MSTPGRRTVNRDLKPLVPNGTPEPEEAVSTVGAAELEQLLANMRAIAAAMDTLDHPEPKRPVLRLIQGGRRD